MSAKTIAVIGSGLAGWSLTGALARVFGALGVNIIFLDNGEPDVVEAECAGEYIHNFNELLGVSLSDIVSKTKSTFSYGTRFKGWAFPGQDFILADSACTKVDGRSDVLQIFAAARNMGLSKKIDEFSLPAVAARLGRFGFPVANVSSIFSSLQFGFNLDVEGYTRVIEEVALSCGVTHIRSRVSSSGEKDACGKLKTLKLANGQECSADLFIDCSSNGDLVRKILAFPENVEPSIPHLQQITSGAMNSDPEFRPCSEWLGVLDGVAQIIPLKDRKVFAIQRQSGGHEGEATTLSGSPMTYSNTARGGDNRHLNDAWIANVVAMGKSAFLLPVTPWGEFKWLRNQVVRFIELFVDFDALEYCADEYNRLSLQEYGMVKELVALTFYSGCMNNNFLADHFNKNPLLSEIQHKLKLFTDVGRHSITSHQVVSESQLSMFFLGNNIIPVWIDGVKSPATSLLEYCENLCSLTYAAAYKLPAYPDFMQQYFSHSQLSKNN